MGARGHEMPGASDQTLSGSPTEAMQSYRSAGVPMSGFCRMLDKVVSRSLAVHLSAGDCVVLHDRQHSHVQRPCGKLTAVLFTVMACVIGHSCVTPHALGHMSQYGSKYATGADKIACSPQACRHSVDRLTKQHRQCKCMWVYVLDCPRSILAMLPSLSCCAPSSL